MNQRQDLDFFFHFSVSIYFVLSLSAFEHFSRSDRDFSCKVEVKEMKFWHKKSS